MSNPYLLIDPFTKSITEVDYNGDWREICKLIDCDMFTVVRGDGYDLFVDDMGLHRKDQAFFLTPDYPQPLAGKALVVSTDFEGETIPPNITLEELEARILWVHAVVWEGDE